MTATLDSFPPVERQVIPEGYMLTTRVLTLRYIDDNDGCWNGSHVHAEHAVFWPERGTASVMVDGQQWSLSCGQGLWVPAGVPHTVDRAPASTLAVTYIHPLAWRRSVAEVGPVSVNSALRELLLHLAVVGMPREERLRAQTVCIEMITRETQPTLGLPMPRNDRISHIAQSILRDPRDNRSIEQWGAATAQSARTIARGFRAETGLTFSQWRTNARLTLAIRLLGEGVPVGTVARRVGYATNSAFTTAFQRVLHRAPSEFVPRR